MTWRNINNVCCIFNSFVRRPSQQASARARQGAGGDVGKTTVLIRAQNKHLILVLYLHSQPAISVLSCSILVEFENVANNAF